MPIQVSASVLTYDMVRFLRGPQIEPLAHPDHLACNWHIRDVRLYCKGI